MSLPLGSSIVLGLAWFAAINLAATAAAWGVAALMMRSGVVRRGGVLLAVRLAPAMASLAFVAALFLPAHWRFEPADARESFGVVLYLFSAMGAALVARSVTRTAAVSRSAWQLRMCRALTAIDSGTGVYEVPSLAGVSLAGVFRTRVLVGTPVRGALTPAELDVALAHELAHRRALDNVKRFVLYCAPDLFSVLGVSRRLEQQWRAASECVADARAVGGDAGRAVNLASALVKVSRMTPGRTAFGSSPVWSTLHDAPLLETRVRRLIGETVPSAGDPRLAFQAGLAAFATLLLLSIALSGGVAVHQVTEHLVQVLP